MAGIDRQTGKIIENDQHIRQSIGVLLTTPLGSRVMRGELGFSCLDEKGSPKPGLEADEVRRAALSVLGEYEPRISDTVVDPRIKEGSLASISVTYNISETGQRDTVVVAYD